MRLKKTLQPVPVANRPHVNGIYATRIAQQVFKFILTVYVIRKVRICKVFGISLNRIMCKSIVDVAGSSLNMLSNQQRIKPSGHIPTKANRRLSFIKV